MKHRLPIIAAAAMIALAGCSSKSAVNGGADAAGGAGSASGADSGYGAGAGSGAGQAGGQVLGDVFFSFDSSAITPEAQDQLKQNAAWIGQNTAQSVTIEGHCDERGTDEYNIALGERRANSTKEYLVQLGVNSAKLSTVSYGEEKPFDPAHNEEAWANNRRAHFVTK